VSAILARVARLLDLDRPAPGDRTRWTVRTAHGVHLVELEQFISGTRVRLDGKTVAHRPPWSFADVPFRFAIGASPAALAVSPDTRAGTIRATLIVDDARIPADVPAWRRRKPKPIPWRAILSRAGYGLAVALIAAAAAGDPFRGWIVSALTTGVDLAWVAAIRGLDPFGLIPPWIVAVTSTRASLLLSGLELGAVVTLATQPRLRSRVPGLRATGRLSRIAAWALLLLAASALPTLVGG
jgi:hypothetical protein